MELFKLQHNHICKIKKLLNAIIAGNILYMNSRTRLAFE